MKIYSIAPLIKYCRASNASFEFFGAAMGIEPATE
jgi:hypothetical protein